MVARHSMSWRVKRNEESKTSAGRKRVGSVFDSATAWNAVPHWRASRRQPDVSSLDALRSYSDSAVASPSASDSASVDCATSADFRKKWIVIFVKSTRGNSVHGFQQSGSVNAAPSGVRKTRSASLA